MRLTERLLGLTLVGSEWVLWVLIALSVVSVAVMVERGIHLFQKQADLEALSRVLVEHLSGRDITGARKAIAAWRGPEVQVALSGLAHFDRGFEAASAAMASTKAQLRVDLERYTGVLATLGNNAPFIGLFGTVLGIIRAFADLARNQSGGAAVVMAGISEALVATAVGLVVAIPAVIFFNIFQGRIRRTLSRVDATANLLLATMSSVAQASAATASGAGALSRKTDGGA
jgi:biopolymer transport protein ExbB